MPLPDRFEQVGIVVGSVLLLALPTNALWVALFGIANPGPSALSVFLPGLVVGWLVATDRIPVTYHEVWAFSILAYVLCLASWAVLGGGFPPADETAAVVLWVVTALAAAVGVRLWTRRGR